MDVSRGAGLDQYQVRRYDAWYAHITVSMAAAAFLTTGNPIAGYFGYFGIFQHVPDIASPSPDARGLLVLLAVSTAAFLLGLIGITRRNIIAG